MRVAGRAVGKWEIRATGDADPAWASAVDAFRRQVRGDL